MTKTRHARVTFFSIIFPGVLERDGCPRYNFNSCGTRYCSRKFRIYLFFCLCSRNLKWSQVWIWLQVASAACGVQTVPYQDPVLDFDTPSMPRWRFRHLRLVPTHNLQNFFLSSSKHTLGENCSATHSVEINLSGKLVPLFNPRTLSYMVVHGMPPTNMDHAWNTFTTWNHRSSLYM